MAYLLHRALGSLALVLAVSALAFVFLDLTPGEFVDDLRVDPQIGTGTIAALREQYGLTDSLPVRYLRWLQGVAAGDFGFSFAYRTPVSSLLWERTANTLLLTFPAIALSWLIALPVGLWSASRPGGLVDRASGATTSALLTLPELLLALLFLLLALRTGWFPAGGMTSAGTAAAGTLAYVRDVAAHAVLPLTALIITTLPALIRHVRASALETAASPAIQAARGHGISERRLAWRHVLPMAAAPLVPLAGLSIATLLSVSMLTEVVLSWPGLGPLVVEALVARDLNVIVAASMLSTLFVVGGNLLADVALAVIDPRVRRQ